MKHSLTDSMQTPWYKIGMVWMMIGLPLIVVVASMVTLVIAHQNAPLIIPSSVEVSKLPNQSDAAAHKISD